MPGPASKWSPTCSDTGRLGVVVAGVGAVTGRGTTPPRRTATGSVRDAHALLDSEHARYTLGEIAVPYGRCSEPANVKAGDGACPVRSAAPAATTSAPTSHTCPS